MLARWKGALGRSHRVNGDNEAACETPAVRSELWNFRQKREFELFWNKCYAKSTCLAELPATRA